MDQEIQPLILVRKKRTGRATKAETVKISAEAYNKVVEISAQTDMSIQRTVSLLVEYAHGCLKWVEEDD